jgi:TldD protein
MGKINHLSKQECYDILNEALKTGADFAEVFMEDTVNYSQEMISCQTTKCNTSMVKGAAFRICKGDVVVNATTTDLSYENLMSEAKKLASNFDGVQETFALEFKDTTNNKIVNINDDRVYDDATPLLTRASKAALAVSKEVVQTVAGVSKKNQHIFVFASDAAYAFDHRCNTRISITVVASDGKNMQSINSNAGGNKAMEQYDEFDAETFGKETAESAITMLHADEMVGGEIPVVIHNGFGGVILHEAAVHGLEATSVARGMSVFCGKIGEKIGSDIVNAVDCGTDYEAWGSLNVDDEGTPTKCNLLIENGVLKSYLVDKRNSKKMNHPITGSSRRQSYRNTTTIRVKIVDGNT